MTQRNELFRTININKKIKTSYRGSKSPDPDTNRKYCLAQQQKWN